MSGSSTVTARRRHFAVLEESPRKIFRAGDGDQQSRWHENWKASHQAGVEAVAERVEPVLAAYAAANPLPLTTWDESLDEACDHETRTSEYLSYEAAKARGRAVRWRVEFARREPVVAALADFQLEIAFEPLPPRAELAALVAALERALSG